MTIKIKSGLKSLAIGLSLVYVLSPLHASAENTKPLSHIDTDCLFTYHFSVLRLDPTEFKKTYRFEPRTVNKKEYMAFIECDENGDYDKDADNNIYAYLREEDNKVYMLLGNAQEPSIMGCVYGMTDKETMIYDYNLEPGDSYRIGNLDDYFMLHQDDTDLMDWIYINANSYAHKGKYYYYTCLCMWNNGEITIRDKRFDEELGREVWTYAQKYFNPDKKVFKTEFMDNYSPCDEDGWRTFEVVDGFGCMQSLLAFPGLFPPYPNFPNSRVSGDNPTLCKVQRIDTKEILFERTDLPHAPLVEELDADGNAAPKYFNIQGMPVSNPAEGEIYIVRRGGKATKEVYRR